VEALGTLTPQQRAAVVLRVLEDLDHAGIAERLGCSVGTARSHLSRGLSGCESGPRPARKWESPDERHP
jgi:DNA-directed RNA polymerase specialized sigma24 family protein